MNNYWNQNKLKKQLKNIMLIKRKFFKALNQKKILVPNINQKDVKKMDKNKKSNSRQIKCRSSPTMEKVKKNSRFQRELRRLRKNIKLKLKVVEKRILKEQ